jgi:plasmid recombination enzyme
MSEWKLVDVEGIGSGYACLTLDGVSTTKSRNLIQADRGAGGDGLGFSDLGTLLIDYADRDIAGVVGITGDQGGIRSIRHNNREFTAANVDRERSEQNIVFVNEDLKRTYNNLFGEALETYNAGKKKTRDKIPDYYEHIRKSKQEKLFHEAIFQIGNLNDCGCGTEGGQRAAEALTAFAKTFQERNPHLYVFNMVLHMDEATPHLHVDYIPVATEQTRGLSTRVSMKQALKQQGFTGVGQKQTEWKAWMDREKEVLTEIAQQHEFEIISLGSNRRHMELPEYRAAIQESEAVQEQTAAALQELADMQEKKTELKGEIKSLSGTVAALKAAERVRVDFDTIQPEKTLTGAVKGVTVEQIQQLKKVAMTGAAAKQAVVELKKKNAALEKENAEMQKKIPSTMDRLLEKKNLELLETRNFNLRQENKELKEALEEERSFSDRLLEGIDRVLDMLERHLPKQLLHLVDKARDLLPEHQTYRQEKQHERGHSWGDMSL